MGANRTHKPFDAYAAEVIRFKARQLVGKAGFTKSDREDLEQELALDFLRRSRNFNPDKSKRSTFTTWVVAHHVATILESRHAPTRDVRKEGPSLDAMIADDGGKQVERITIMDARANHPGRSPEELHPLKLNVQSVIETLPPRLREIAEGSEDALGHGNRPTTRHVQKTYAPPGEQDSAAFRRGWAARLPALMSQVADFAGKNPLRLM